MGSKRLVSLGFELTLLVLLLLLLLDHAQELVALSLGLLGQHYLTLDKLLPPGQVQILGLLSG